VDGYWKLHSIRTTNAKKEHKHHSGLIKNTTIIVWLAPGQLGSTDSKSGLRNSYHHQHPSVSLHLQPLLVYDILAAMGCGVHHPPQDKPISEQVLHLTDSKMFYPDLSSFYFPFLKYVHSKGFQCIIYLVFLLCCVLCTNIYIALKG